jgi:hypothetical protein
MKKKDIDTLVTYYKNLGKMLRLGIMESITEDGQQPFEIGPIMKRAIEIEQLRIVDCLAGYVCFSGHYGVEYLPKYKALEK